ncbi:MAG TPA: Uma2 family endonuclease [Pyrinomonadaceae bacterium]|jgi:Uma2 family endonuclease|nr:Uma2 family endonuclease [Pyrinomonadaceae bacterium]
MARNLTQADEYVLPEELLGLHPPITPEQFEELCSEYRDLRLELTSTGELIVMPPTGSLTGKRTFNLTAQLALWFKEHGTGVCFATDSGFTLPNGAIRGPDAAWMKRERWDRLTKEGKERFAPICPDFVVELRSPSDSLRELDLKMFEYLENGALLGWLIDPSKRRVYVYRPNQETVVLDNPETVSADPLLPGFELNLTELWSVD